MLAVAGALAGRATGIRPTAALVCFVVMCCWGGPLIAAAQTIDRPVPTLLVEGPDSLLSTRESIARLAPERFRALMQLVGLAEPGPPIHVLLLPEDSPGAADVPSWVAGYADGEASLIVLFPERTPSYPDASFEALVIHEVAHVLIDRAAEGNPVPRWFHEGLATAAGSWGLGDRSRVTLALLFGRDHTLASVAEAFSSDDNNRIGRAYALSTAFVRDLLSREGADVAARILAARARTSAFEPAFAQATGTSLALAEQVFWARHNRWYRWVPLLASSTTFWAGIVVLAVWARRRRAARAAEIQRRWDAEGLPLDGSVR